MKYLYLFKQILLINILVILIYNHIGKLFLLWYKDIENWLVSMGRRHQREHLMCLIISHSLRRENINIKYNKIK